MKRLFRIWRLLFPSRVRTEGTDQPAAGAGRRSEQAGRPEQSGQDAPHTGMAGTGYKIPLHMAVFMDGNGRWARQRGLPRTAGHRAGAENLKSLCRMCGRYGIRYLTVYAFSTENWNRPAAEVQALMDLFVEFFRRYDREMEDEGIRLRFAGDHDGLPQSVLEVMAEAEAASASRDRLQLIIAINYGSRREIARACRKLALAAASGQIDPDTIDEQAVARSLYLPDIPDPDLVIRPSGEQRLSNFLLWQSAYAELWFSDILWPDFKEEHLKAALADFTRRDRRFGGIGQP